MFIQLYIVLTFCFCFSSAQTTYYFIGNNNTWSNADNWSPTGPPTDGSIVHINVSVEFDVAELSLLEFHFNGSSNSYINFNLNGILRVTSKFTWVGIYSTLYFSAAEAELHFDSGCEASITYSSASGWTSSTSTYKYGAIYNNGTVSIHPNPDLTGTQTFSIGYNAINFIENWGNWVVDSGVSLLISDTDFNHYAGTYNSTMEGSDPNIKFYDTNFKIQGYSENNFANGPIWFYSYYTLANTILFNTTDVIFSNGVFNSYNIIFNYPATIMDSVFSGPLLNASMTGITVTIAGDNTFFSSLKIAGDLTLFVEKDTTIYHDTYTYSIYIIENAVFINDGNMINTSYSIYLDKNAWFVNNGLIQLDGGASYNIYSYSTATELGTIVNRGTIQLTAGSYFYITTSYPSQFLQCKDANIKLGYGTPLDTSYPGKFTFTKLYIDGYISIWVGKNYKITGYELIVNYDESLYTTNVLPDGNAKLSSTYEDSTTINPLTLCVYPSYGQFFLYPILEGGCSDYSSTAENFEISLNDGGDACTNVPAAIMDLTPSCTISANCGSLETKIPFFAPSSAGIQSASFALLVTLMGYLFFY